MRSTPIIRDSWIIELAEQMRLIPPGLERPTSAIVGGAIILGVSSCLHSHGETP
jgi:hypothetical protein